MNNFTRLKDCVVTNKNVIVRVDINVPISKGLIEDDTRIRAIIPTLKYLLDNQAKVIVISHFGRPAGKKVIDMSLSYLVNRLSELLKTKVNFIDDCIGDKVKKEINNIKYGEIILLENLRFYKEETTNNLEFARELASLGNLYVNDAFSCSHRAHASIVGIPSILKSCAGFLLEYELDNLQNLLTNPKKPLLAIVGGSKVSSKIDLLNSLMLKADSIFIGGGMANTFLYALGRNIGKSLCEKDLKDTALDILKKAEKLGCHFIFPEEVVICKKIETNAEYQVVDSNQVTNEDIIADIGPKTIGDLALKIEKCKTVIWNGPIGIFETMPFNIGTNSLARIIANATKKAQLTSVAGGGDVVAALNASGLIKEFTYISTAGGAFLEWLEGKTLPGIDKLNSR